VECSEESSQRRGDAERGQMASKEDEERGARALYARGDLGSEWACCKRFVGLGGSLGMASWIESSDASVELASVQQRPGLGWFQFRCAWFRSRAGHVEV
jgi:hypothetical protein